VDEDGGGGETRKKAVKRLLAGLRRLALGRRIQYRTEGFSRNLRQHAMASLAGAYTRSVFGST
jgi:hypothetical protein